MGQIGTVENPSKVALKKTKNYGKLQIILVTSLADMGDQTDQTNHSHWNEYQTDDERTVKHGKWLTFSFDESVSESQWSVQEMLAWLIGLPTQTGLPCLLTDWPTDTQWKVLIWPSVPTPKTSLLVMVPSVMHIWKISQKPQKMSELGKTLLPVCQRR